MKTARERNTDSKGVLSYYEETNPNLYNVLKNSDVVQELETTRQADNQLHQLKKKRGQVPTTPAVSASTTNGVPDSPSVSQKVVGAVASVLPQPPSASARQTTQYAKNLAELGRTASFRDNNYNRTPNPNLDKSYKELEEFNNNLSKYSGVNYEFNQSDYEAHQLGNDRGKRGQIRELHINQAAQAEKAIPEQLATAREQYTKLVEQINGGTLSSSEKKKRLDSAKKEMDGIESYAQERLQAFNDPFYKEQKDIVLAIQDLRKINIGTFDGKTFHFGDTKKAKQEFEEKAGKYGLRFIQHAKSKGQLQDVDEQQIIEAFTNGNNIWDNIKEMFADTDKEKFERSFPDFANEMEQKKRVIDVADTFRKNRGDKVSIDELSWNNNTKGWSGVFQDVESALLRGIGQTFGQGKTRQWIQGGMQVVTDAAIHPMQWTDTVKRYFSGEDITKYGSDELINLVTADFYKQGQAGKNVEATSLGTANNMTKNITMSGAELVANLRFGGLRAGGAMATATQRPAATMANFASKFKQGSFGNRMFDVMSRKLPSRAAFATAQDMTDDIALKFATDGTITSGRRNMLAAMESTDAGKQYLQVIKAMTPEGIAQERIANMALTFAYSDILRQVGDGYSTEDAIKALANGAVFGATNEVFMKYFEKIASNVAKGHNAFNQKFNGNPIGYNVDYYSKLAAGARALSNPFGNVAQGFYSAAIEGQDYGYKQAMQDLVIGSFFGVRDHQQYSGDKYGKMYRQEVQEYLRKVKAGIYSPLDVAIESSQVGEDLAMASQKEQVTVPVKEAINEEIKTEDIGAQFDGNNEGPIMDSPFTLNKPQQQVKEEITVDKVPEPVIEETMSPSELFGKTELPVNEAIGTLDLDERSIAALGGITSLLEGTKIKIVPYDPESEQADSWIMSYSPSENTVYINDRPDGKKLTKAQITKRLGEELMHAYDYKVMSSVTKAGNPTREAKARKKELERMRDNFLSQLNSQQFDLSREGEYYRDWLERNSVEDSDTMFNAFHDEISYYSAAQDTMRDITEFSGAFFNGASAIHTLLAESVNVNQLSPIGVLKDAISQKLGNETADILSEGISKVAQTNKVELTQTGEVAQTGLPEDAQGTFTIPTTSTRKDNRIEYSFQAEEKILKNINSIRSWEKNKSIDQNTLWDKIQKLGIAKDEIELIKQQDGLTVEEKLKSFLENYSFPIEIEVAKPTQYYTAISVPGGTNNTENRIVTPNIVPSIKGHAKFAKDNDIGWFLSDDKTIRNYSLDEILSNEYDSNKNIQNTDDTSQPPFFEPKIRRVREIQSDLFQKGREAKVLVENSINSNGNKFLQLLNKDNNWVTIFVKSIIQDSAKKGYEKVLFPLGDTASKIEGHTTLEQYKKEKENKLIKLEEEKKSIREYYTITDGFSTSYEVKTIEEANKEIKKRGEDFFIIDGVEFRKTSINNEINELKEELKELETEKGIAKHKPIHHFYENTIFNILKKQGYNPIVFTDEHGNSWYETTLEKPTFDAQDTVPFGVKKGVKEVFEENPDLKKIGDEKLYSEYLDTIFPDSKVKDIVWRGDIKGLDKFTQIDSEGHFKASEYGFNYGIFLSSDRDYVAREYAIGKQLYAALINSNKIQEIGTPLQMEVVGNAFLENETNPTYRPEFYNLSEQEQELAYQYYLKNKDEIVVDTIVGNDSNSQGIEIRDNIKGLEYAVYRPNQIHILGSKQDIEGFRQFAQSKLPKDAQGTAPFVIRAGLDRNPRKTDIGTDLLKKATRINNMANGYKNPEEYLAKLVERAKEDETWEGLTDEEKMDVMYNIGIEDAFGEQKKSVFDKQAFQNENVRDFLREHEGLDKETPAYNAVMQALKAKPSIRQYFDSADTQSFEQELFDYVKVRSAMNGIVVLPEDMAVEARKLWRKQHNSQEFAVFDKEGNFVENRQDKALVAFNRLAQRLFEEQYMRYASFEHGTDGKNIDSPQTKWSKSNPFAKPIVIDTEVLTDTDAVDLTNKFLQNGIYLIPKGARGFVGFDMRSLTEPIRQAFINGDIEGAQKRLREHENYHVWKMLDSDSTWRVGGKPKNIGAMSNYFDMSLLLAKAKDMLDGRDGTIKDLVEVMYKHLQQPKGKDTKIRQTIDEMKDKEEVLQRLNDIVGKLKEEVLVNIDGREVPFYALRNLKSEIEKKLEKAVYEDISDLRTEEIPLASDLDTADAIRYKFIQDQLTHISDMSFRWFVDPTYSQALQKGTGKISKFGDKYWGVVTQLKAYSTFKRPSDVIYTAGKQYESWQEADWKAAGITFDSEGNMQQKWLVIDADVLADMGIESDVINTLVKKNADGASFYVNSLTRDIESDMMQYPSKASSVKPAYVNYDGSMTVFKTMTHDNLLFPEGPMNKYELALHDFAETLRLKGISRVIINSGAKLKGSFRYRNDGKYVYDNKNVLVGMVQGDKINTEGVKEQYQADLLNAITGGEIAPYLLHTIPMTGDNGYSLLQGSQSRKVTKRSFGIDSLIHRVDGNFNSALAPLTSLYGNNWSKINGIVKAAKYILFGEGETEKENIDNLISNLTKRAQQLIESGVEVVDPTPESLIRDLNSARNVDGEYDINRLNAIRDLYSLSLSKYINEATDYAFDNYGKNAVKAIGLVMQPFTGSVADMERIAVFDTNQAQYFYDKMSDGQLAKVFQLEFGYMPELMSREEIVSKMVKQSADNAFNYQEAAKALYTKDGIRIASAGEMGSTMSQPIVIGEDDYNVIKAHMDSEYPGRYLGLNGLKVFLNVSPKDSPESYMPLTIVGVGQHSTGMRLVGEATTDFTGTDFDGDNRGLMLPSKEWGNDLVSSIDNFNKFHQNMVDIGIASGKYKKAELSAMSKSGNTDGSFNKSFILADGSTPNMADINNNPFMPDYYNSALKVNTGMDSGVSMIDRIGTFIQDVKLQKSPYEYYDKRSKSTIIFKLSPTITTNLQVLKQLGVVDKNTPSTLNYNDLMYGSIVESFDGEKYSKLTMQQKEFLHEIVNYRISKLSDSTFAGKVRNLKKDYAKAEQNTQTSSRLKDSINSLVEDASPSVKGIATQVYNNFNKLKRAGKLALTRNSMFDIKKSQYKVEDIAAMKIGDIAAENTLVKDWLTKSKPSFVAFTPAGEIKTIGKGDRSFMLKFIPYTENKTAEIRIEDFISETGQVTEKGLEFLRSIPDEFFAQFYVAKDEVTDNVRMIPFYNNSSFGVHLQEMNKRLAGKSVANFAKGYESKTRSADKIAGDILLKTYSDPKTIKKYPLIDIINELRENGIEPQIYNGEVLTEALLNKIQEQSYAPTVKTGSNPLKDFGFKPEEMNGNRAKDIEMAEIANKFIGFQSGKANVSSTRDYAIAWGDAANTGNYKSSDTIMVSASGTWRGVTANEIEATFQSKYKPLLDEAINADSKFVVGSAYHKGNLGDKLVADYLQSKGYEPIKKDGYNLWTKQSTSTTFTLPKDAQGTFFVRGVSAKMDYSNLKDEAERRLGRSISFSNIDEIKEFTNTVKGIADEYLKDKADEKALGSMMRLFNPMVADEFERYATDGTINNPVQAELAVAAYYNQAAKSIEAINASKLNQDGFRGMLTRFKANQMFMVRDQEALVNTVAADVRGYTGDEVIGMNTVVKFVNNAEDQNGSEFVVEPQPVMLRNLTNKEFDMQNFAVAESKNFVDYVRPHTLIHHKSNTVDNIIKQGEKMISNFNTPQAKEGIKKIHQAIKEGNEIPITFDIAEGTYDGVTMPDLRFSVKANNATIPSLSLSDININDHITRLAESLFSDPTLQDGAKMLIAAKLNDMAIGIVHGSIAGDIDYWHNIKAKNNGIPYRKETSKHIDNVVQELSNSFNDKLNGEIYGTLNEMADARTIDGKANKASVAERVNRFLRNNLDDSAYVKIGREVYNGEGQDDEVLASRVRRRMERIVERYTSQNKVQQSYYEKYSDKGAEFDLEYMGNNEIVDLMYAMGDGDNGFVDYSADIWKERRKNMHQDFQVGIDNSFLSAYLREPNKNEIAHNNIAQMLQSGQTRGVLINKRENLHNIRTESKATFDSGDNVHIDNGVGRIANITFYNADGEQKTSQGLYLGIVNRPIVDGEGINIGYEPTIVLTNENRQSVHLIGLNNVATWQSGIHTDIIGSAENSRQENLKEFMKANNDTILSFVLNNPRKAILSKDGTATVYSPKLYHKVPDELLDANRSSLLQRAVNFGWETSAFMSRMGYLGGTAAVSVVPAMIASVATGNAVPAAMALAKTISKPLMNSLGNYTSSIRAAFQKHGFGSLAYLRDNKNDADYAKYVQNTETQRLNSNNTMSSTLGSGEQGLNQYVGSDQQNKRLYAPFVNWWENATVNKKSMPSIREVLENDPDLAAARLRAIEAIEAEEGNIQGKKDANNEMYEIIETELKDINSRIKFLKDVLSVENPEDIFTKEAQTLENDKMGAAKEMKGLIEQKKSLQTQRKRLDMEMKSLNNIGDIVNITDEIGGTLGAIIAEKGYQASVVKDQDGNLRVEMIDKYGNTLNDIEVGRLKFIEALTYATQLFGWQLSSEATGLRLSTLMAARALHADNPTLASKASNKILVQDQINRLASLAAGVYVKSVNEKNPMGASMTIFSHFQRDMAAYTMYDLPQKIRMFNQLLDIIGQDTDGLARVKRYFKKYDINVDELKITNPMKQFSRNFMINAGRLAMTVAGNFILGSAFNSLSNMIIGDDEEEARKKQGLPAWLLKQRIDTEEFMRLVGMNDSMFNAMSFIVTAGLMAGDLMGMDIMEDMTEGKKTSTIKGFGRGLEQGPRTANLGAYQSKVTDALMLSLMYSYISLKNPEESSKFEENANDYLFTQLINKSSVAIPLAGPLAPAAAVGQMTAQVAERANK